MKKTKATPVPLLWVCIMAVLLHIIPQTRTWSPFPMDYGEMFRISPQAAFLMALIMAVYAGLAGIEPLKRLGAVVLPMLLAGLLAGAICHFAVGLQDKFLPLLAMVPVTSDILLIATAFCGLFAALKKGRKKSKISIDKSKAG